MADINATPLHAPGPDMGPDEHAAEVDLARRLAERYRLEFVDMDTFRIDQDLFQIGRAHV